MSEKTKSEFHYPKSSCFCYQCTNNIYPYSSGVDTNFPIKNCNVDDKYYDCYNYRLFKKQEEPRNLPGNKAQALDPTGNSKNTLASNFSPSYMLNNLNTANHNPDFYPIECDGNKPVIADEQKETSGRKDGCPPVTWVSNDPRLLDPIRNITLQLDRPPYSSSLFSHRNPDDRINMMKIYSPEYEGYGQCYSSYNDIDAGDIYYYIDTSREDAYYKPNFTIKTNTYGGLFKDPMGTIKPVYHRQVIDFPDKNYNSLSWIRDSNWHKEDIMAGQMAVRNQQRYEPRYTNNNNI